MKGITGRKVKVANCIGEYVGIFLDWGVVDGQTMAIVEEKYGAVNFEDVRHIQFVETAKFWEGVI